jgi:hypothetical protein
MKRVRSGVGFVLFFLLTTGSVALADVSSGDGGAINPGVRVGEWITNNVTALFAPLLAVTALYYLAKRQFTQFLSFAVFAMLAALFIFGGSEFKDAALGLVKWIIGQ